MHRHYPRRLEKVDHRVDVVVFNRVLLAREGVTWNYRSQPIYDAREDMIENRFTYANLLGRPNGDIHCYYLHIETNAQSPRGHQPTEGIRNAISLSVSQDGGKTWGDPSPIVGQGKGCWKKNAQRSYRYDYRSPWPIQLSDGRIVVVFARRSGPRGIGG